MLNFLYYTSDFLLYESEFQNSPINIAPASLLCCKNPRVCHSESDFGHNANEFFPLPLDTQTGPIPHCFLWLFYCPKSAKLCGGLVALLECRIHGISE